MLKLYDLQTEYQNSPLGLDEKNPAFSWKLTSDHTGVRQEKCRIQVCLNDEEVWDTGILETDRSICHVYAGQPLEPKKRYDVSVTVMDNYGEQADIQGFFETGLLDPHHFEADFITHGFEDTLEPCAVFVRNFRIEKKVVKARAYVSALGIYSIQLNGKRVSDVRFAPGWTSYQERLQYQVYDITEYLRDENTLEVTVANGWYKGILGFYEQGCHYGKRTALIAQIDMTYEDGTTKRLVTDENWHSTTGERRYSEFYHGEVIDYSLEKQPVKPVRRYEYPKENLVGQLCEPVRITERVPAKKVLKSPKGEMILDFGQNLTGVVEARLCCPKGTKVVLRHAEALDENGNLFTTNLRTAKATDTFICSGGEDVFLPEFTFHGFRYVSVEGLENVEAEDFIACVLHTDFTRGGRFSCSNEDVNRLWKNIDWTMRSNYLDIPMDCPQRDERLGYTGDAEIFLPTALFHGNLALFYRKWLRDLRVEQSDEYGVPLTVPDILRTRVCVSIWHEAATIVPWMIWQTYGDLRILEEQYDSMKASVEYTKRMAGERGILLLENSSQFGDWVAIDAPKGPFRRPPEGELCPSMDEKAGGTDSHLIGNVYYLYSIDILAKTAALLSRQEDAEDYRKLYQEVLLKFREEYITPSGRLVSETQTAAALVLYFDLAEKKDRGRILNQLKMNLIKTNKHLRTGFVGTEYLPHVLSRENLHQLAGDILLKEDCPSWLYAVKLGATTVWELWDGVNPDHSFNLFSMNSLNQYGFATIGDWLVKELAGLSALKPGYRISRIAPRLVRGITAVSAGYETPYGELSCELSCKEGRIQADVRIPENTEAFVSLPGRNEEKLGSGTYHFAYETDLSYEYEPYSEDSLLKELLAHPVAKEYFADKEPKLAKNAFVNHFAGKLSIAEIKMTIPQTMIPERAYPVFDEMIALLNRKEKNTTV